MSIHSRYDDTTYTSNINGRKRLDKSGDPIKCEKCRQSRAHVKIANYYCKQCIQDTVPRRLRDALCQNCAIPRYQRAILAYSGGPFSTFLLHAMMQLRSIPMDPIPWLSILQSNTSSPDTESSAVQDQAQNPCVPSYLAPLALPSTDTSSRIAIQSGTGQIYSRYLSGLPQDIDLNTISTADILRMDPNPDKSLQPVRILPVWIDDRPLTYAFAGGSVMLNAVRNTDASYLPEGLKITLPVGARAVPAISLPFDTALCESLYCPQFVPSDTNADSDQKSDPTVASPEALLQSLVLKPHIRFVRVPGLRSLSPADVSQSRAKADSQKRKNKKKELKKKLQEQQSVSEGSTAGDVQPAESEVPSTQQDEVASDEAKRPEPILTEEEHLHAQGEVVIPILVMPIGWPEASTGTLEQQTDSYKRKLAALRTLFLSLPTSTERQDFVAKMVRRQLVSLAARLDCPRLLLGDTLSSTAVDIVKNMAKANGVTLPGNANYTECVYPAPKFNDVSLTSSTVISFEAEAKQVLPSEVCKVSLSNIPVFLHRPLRDFTTKFVSVLLHYWRVPYALTPQLLSRHDLLTNGSINRLSETFLANLDRGNDLTSHNVVRTLEKVRVPGTKVPQSGRVIIPDYPMRDVTSPQVQSELHEELQSVEPNEVTDARTMKPTTSLSTSALGVLVAMLNKRMAEAETKSSEGMGADMAAMDGMDEDDDESQSGGQVSRAVNAKDPSEWQGQTEMSIEEVRARARDRGRQLASQYAILDEPEVEATKTSSPEPTPSVRDEEATTIVTKAVKPMVKPTSQVSSCCNSSSEAKTCCGNETDSTPKAMQAGCCGGSGKSAGTCRSVTNRNAHSGAGDDDDPDLDDAPTCGRPVGQKSLSAIRGRGVQLTRTTQAKVVSERADEFLEHSHVNRCAMCGCERLKIPQSILAELKAQEAVRQTRNRREATPDETAAEIDLKDRCCFPCFRLLTSSSCTPTGRAFPSLSHVYALLD